MKRVMVRMECVLELPDHVRIEEPVSDAGEMLAVHGRLLQPDIGWMAVCKIEDGGGMTLEGLPDELEDELREAVTEVRAQDLRILADDD